MQIDGELFDFIRVFKGFGVDACLPLSNGSAGKVRRPARPGAPMIEALTNE